jgi:hypothetical protein
MPFPTVNAVLQMAYTEARNMAKRPVAKRGSPVMLEAISFVSLSEILCCRLTLAWSTFAQLPPTVLQAVVTRTIG